MILNVKVSDILHIAKVTHEVSEIGFNFFLAIFKTFLEVTGTVCLSPFYVSSLPYISLVLC